MSSGELQHLNAVPCAIPRHST